MAGLITSDMDQINTLYTLNSHNVICHLYFKNKFKYKNCFWWVILECMKTLLISLIYYRLVYPWTVLETFVEWGNESVIGLWEWVSRVCVSFVQLSDICNNYLPQVATLHSCYLASWDFRITPSTTHKFSFKKIDIFLTPIVIFIIRIF